MNENKTQIIKKAQKVVDEAAESLAEEVNRLLAQEAEFAPELAYELVGVPEDQAYPSKGASN